MYLIMCLSKPSEAKARVAVARFWPNQESYGELDILLYLVEVGLWEYEIATAFVPPE
jgi:hypothetical protein